MNSTQVENTKSNSSLWRAFSEVVSQNPDRIAVSATEIQWSYAQLAERAERLARSLPVTEGNKPIAISIEKNATLVEFILAIAWWGRPFLYLDPQDTVIYRQSVFEASGAQLLLVENENQKSSFGSHVNVIACDALTELESSKTPFPNVSEVGCLIQTSGSSGKPKLVPILCEAMIQNGTQFANTLQITPNDRVGWLASPKVAAANSAYWGALLNGACLCPFSFHESGFSDLADWLNRESISVIHLVPSLLRSLLRTIYPEALQSVRAVKLGGEPVTISDYTNFRQAFPSDCRLYNGLGMSEAGGNVCHCEITDATAAIEDKMPVGKPLPDYNCKLIDKNGEVVPVGEKGELVISSPWLMPGYIEATKESSFIELQNGTRAFRTRDIGCFGANGMLYILGRADRRIKLRGYSVNLDDIEAQIRKIPEIQDVSTLLENEHGRDQVVAYVVTPHTQNIVSEFIKRQLPQHLHAIQICLMDALPRTAGGKIDRSSLSNTRANKLHIISPRNVKEEEIFLLWSALLKREDIDVYEDFFEAGGDSLAAIELIVQLERHFKRKFPAGWILWNSTIAQMACDISLRSKRSIFWPRLLKRFVWDQVQLKSGSSMNPWLILPGGYAGEGSLLNFANICRNFPDNSSAYGFKIRRGPHWKFWPREYKTNVKALIKAVDIASLKGIVNLVGECIGSPIAISLASHLSLLGIPHRLILLDPLASSGRMQASGFIPGWEAYCHQIANASPNPYIGHVTVFHTGESFDVSGLRKIWNSALCDAVIDLHSVEGDHYSYIREHQLSLAEHLYQTSNQ